MAGTNGQELRVAREGPYPGGVLVSRDPCVRHRRRGRVPRGHVVLGVVDDRRACREEKHEGQAQEARKGGLYDVHTKVKGRRESQFLLS